MKSFPVFPETTALSLHESLAVGHTTPAGRIPAAGHAREKLRKTRENQRKGTIPRRCVFSSGIGLGIVWRLI